MEKTQILADSGFLANFGLWPHKMKICAMAQKNGNYGQVSGWSVLNPTVFRR